MDGLNDLADFLWNNKWVGFACVLTAPVLIFLLIIRIKKKYFPKKYRPAKEYIQVTGKLIRIEQKKKGEASYDNPLPYRFVFKFTTLGDDVIEGESTPPLLNSLGLAEGNKVKIFYHPRNPYDFFVQ